MTSPEEVASQKEAAYDATAPSMTLRSDVLPRELLRGITPRKLLSFFGQILRKLPDGLPHEAKDQLFNRSSPVDGLAFFISHCWGSPGWQKYLALLFHLLGNVALFVGSLAAVTVLYLQWYHYDLPYLSTRYDHFLKLSWGVSQWEFFVGVGVFWSILLLGHNFHWCKPAFLDCACINQTDHTRKMKGITHLGSFLRASDELVILWDARYFKRGWCAYELASFLALNPQGRISFLPLKASVARLVIHLAYLVGHAAFFVMWPYFPDLHVCSAAVALVSFLCGLPAVVACDWYWRDVLALQSQLESFAFEDTNVKEENDREAILKSITEMYPDGGVAKFDHTVNTSVKEIVLNEFSKRRCPLSYPDALLATFPATCGCVSYLSSTRRLSPPFRMAALVYNVSFAFAICPTSLALCMECVRPSSTGKHTECTNRLCLHNLRNAAVLALMFVGLCVLAFYLPCGVAAGVVPELNSNPWHGFFMAPLVNLPNWLVCAWFYWPQGRSQASKRQNAVAIGED